MATTAGKIALVPRKPMSEGELLEQVRTALATCLPVLGAQNTFTYASNAVRLSNQGLAFSLQRALPPNVNKHIKDLDDKLGIKLTVAANTLIQAYEAYCDQNIAHHIKLRYPTDFKSHAAFIGTQSFTEQQFSGFVAEILRSDDMVLPTIN